MRTRLALATTTALVVSGLIVLPIGTVSAGPTPPPGVPTGLTKCTQALAAFCGSIEVPLDRTGATTGTTTIGFQYYPATDTTDPVGTIVAHEGGPGYATTDSADYFLDLLNPLRRQRAVLLVDERGTGLSDPLDCPEAQDYDGDWVEDAAICGQQLGPLSDLYTSAAAAQDMADVLDSLEIDVIDLYGDSYGSFFAQTFATRFPDRVRSLVLDGTYPIEGLDPWYATTATRLRDNLALFCRRSPSTCPVAPRQVVSELDEALESLRDEPLTTTAPDGYGYRVTVRLNPRRVLDTLLYSDVTPGYVRAIPAALVAFNDGNALPLARMVAEVDGPSGAAIADKTGIPRPNAEIRSFSEGAYLAYACTDYPALWDVNAGPRLRQDQYDEAVDQLPATVTSPWTPNEWARSNFFVYDYCIGWPKPRVAEPPFPGGRYPDLPTLVLNGDLDLRTDVYQARDVAANFPNSTYVEVPNYGHVTALYDPDQCTSAIVRRFVRTLEAGDTSCVGSIPQHQTIRSFPEKATDAPQATVGGPGDRSTASDRRAAYVTVETVADVVDRWYAIPGYTGTSLYGGSFSMYTTNTDPFVSRIWSLKLNRLRWTRDIEVTGTGTMPRANGMASMELKIRGAGTDSGNLLLTWQTREPGGLVTVTGQIGGRQINLRAPAPSYF